MSSLRQLFGLPGVLALAGLFLCCGCATAQADSGAPTREQRSEKARPRPPQRPNVVFILADDLGYMDVASYAARMRAVPRSRTYYETPHIDRLVGEGLAFSHAYVSQLCSPTRASLLTGRYASEIGFTTATPFVPTYYSAGRQPPEGFHPLDAVSHSDPIEMPQALRNATTLTGLPSGQPLDDGRDVQTFAEAMTEHEAAFVGKWHVGGHGAAGYQPASQGFEELAYYDAGGSPYFDWRKLWNRTKPPFSAMPQEEWEIGDAGTHSDARYLTDALTQEAVHYLRAQAASQADAGGEPFLLYINHFAQHAPLQAPEEDIAYFKSKATRGWNGHDNATYAAMLKHLDTSVGAILQALAETGLDENTLVVFGSDNGGVSWPLGRPEQVPTSNAPLKGGKAMLFEGGIRVPLIFWWKGRLPGGQWSDVPVHGTDLYPTLLDAAGYDLDVYEGPGESLVPLFDDPQNQQGHYTRDTFYWHYPFNVIVDHPDDGLPLTPHSAIRRGDDKLVVDWHGRLQLYDLAADPYEEHNLVEKRPERARVLFRQLTAWLDANVAPRYVAAPRESYDPETDPRPYPFIDLRDTWLGAPSSGDR